MALETHPRFPIISVLANRDFRTIWYVGSLAEIARRIELLVLGWLILERTDSYFLLGLVLVFNHVARPVLSLFTGLIADRFDRRLILFAAQTVSVLTAGAVLTAMVVEFEAIRPWHIFAVVLLQGAIRSVEDPSRRTGIMDIVGTRRLVNALSLDVLTHTGGKLVGPLMAGIVLAAAGFQAAYVCVLVVHLVNLVLVTRLNIPRSQGNPNQEPVWRSLAVGIRHAWGSRELLGVMYVTVIMNALAFPVQQFVPAVGRDNLHVGVGLVGLLVAAEGFGQVAGAAVLALSRNLGNRGLIFVLGSMLVLFTAGLFAWAPWYALALLILGIGGMGQSTFGTMQSAITLLAAPPEMRGRMMGVLSQCIGFGTILGGLEMGLVAGQFGIQWSIWVNIMAGILLLAPVLMFSTLVRLRSPEGQPVAAEDSAIAD